MNILKRILLAEILVMLCLNADSLKVDLLANKTILNTSKWDGRFLNTVVPNYNDKKYLYDKQYNRFIIDNVNNFVDIPIERAVIYDKPEGDTEILLGVKFKPFQPTVDVLDKLWSIEYTKNEMENTEIREKTIHTLSKLYDGLVINKKGFSNEYQWKSGNTIITYMEMPTVSSAHISFRNSRTTKRLKPFLKLTCIITSLERDQEINHSIDIDNKKYYTSSNLQGDITFISDERIDLICHRKDIKTVLKSTISRITGQYNLKLYDNENKVFEYVGKCSAYIEKKF